MQAIIDMFHGRVREISLYVKAIKKLDQKSIDRSMKEPYFDTEFIKILKANTLLMIYNLVESTVMGGILEIYDKLKQEGLTYRDVRKEIKDIWFLYKFKQAYDPNAHYNSYKNKALEIVNSILEDKVVELAKEATSISGNLDAQQIREVCGKHGIKFKPNAKSHGGSVLTEVKECRNNLAHGTVSFVECGRDYSIEEINEIKKTTILFLHGLLTGMKQYYDEKQYRLSSSE